jgi:hypothetical protein
MAATSPSAPSGAKFHFLIAAGWTLHNSIGPALGHKMCDAIVWVGEVYDCFLKALWLAIHNVPHCLNTTQKQWSSQGNYCPIKDEAVILSAAKNPRIRLCCCMFLFSSA